MDPLNIPSYNALLSTQTRIRAIQELYEHVSKLKAEVDVLNNLLDPVDNVLWVGAGQSYTDVMTSAHMIPVNEIMQINPDVICADEDHIIIVVDSSFDPYFRRADIGGIEILFNKTTETVDSKDYSVYISENTYSAGTYNIDING